MTRALWDCDVTAIKFLHELQERQWLPRLSVGVSASKSDCRRWLDQGAVEVDGEIVKWDSILTFPLKSFVFFPRNQKRKTTMWASDDWMARHK